MTPRTAVNRLTSILLTNFALLGFSLFFTTLCAALPDAKVDTLQMVYYIGLQYSGCPVDGKENGWNHKDFDDDYYETTYYGGLDKAYTLYIKEGPHCCTTGYSPHGQKLNVVPTIAQK